MKEQGPLDHNAVINKLSQPSLEKELEMSKSWKGSEEEETARKKLNQNYVRSLGCSV